MSYILKQCSESGLTVSQRRSLTYLEIIDYR
jgi:hypothetical protein